MATALQRQKFISQIAPIIQKYAQLNGYSVCSPIIAQACCESAYGTSLLGSKYHNYFGMKCGSSWKGKSVNMKTREEYTKGVLTNISANFRVYDSMEEGVRGYFAFISVARYANLKNATSPIDYLELIKKDGYATSSTYVTTNYNIIVLNDLFKYDLFEASTTFYAKYYGSSNSLVNALSAVGETDTTFTHRRKIAKENGYNIYLGTASQNLALLNLLRQGLLKRA